MRGEDEEETKGGADAVARDHGRLQGPAVDKDSGQNAEGWRWGACRRSGRRWTLLSGRVELEGEDADDGEECEEVSEDGDDLGRTRGGASWGCALRRPWRAAAGSSGSMGGFGIDSAGAGLGEVVLMRGEFYVTRLWVKIRP